jgi:asparagine synthase (glutamine-hydrolysing)
MSPAVVAGDGLFNASAVDKLVSKARTQGLNGFRDNAAFVGVLSTTLWHETFTRRRGRTEAAQATRG